MAVIIPQEMNWNSVTAPSTAATAVTKTTSTTGAAAIATLGFTLRSTSTTGNNLVEAELPVDDKIGFLVTFRATQVAASVLTVSAGTARRAYKRGQGNATVTLRSTRAGGSGSMYFLGPYEGARFATVTDSTDIGAGRNTVEITITTSSGGSAATQRGRANIVAFKMPTVTYST